jgi:hypothetical protein
MEAREYLLHHLRLRVSAQPIAAHGRFPRAGDEPLEKCDQSPEPRHATAHEETPDVRLCNDDIVMRHGTPLPFLSNNFDNETYWAVIVA